MPTLKVTPAEARELAWDSNDWEEVEDEVVDTSRRWSEDHLLIIKRLSDDTFWETSYSCGKTEVQDEAPFEYDDEVTFTQVEKVEVKVLQWRPVKD